MRSVVTESQVRLGLVGAGRWGMTHLETLLGVDPSLVTTVFDPSRVALANAARLVPSARLLPVFDLEGWDSLHGVIVATPTTTHTEIATRALRAGIHVLLEKPIATSSDDARRIEEASAASSAQCLVGNQMLHHPAVECLRTSIAAGLIGRPISLASVRTSKQRAGDDPLWALGPHDLALTLAIAERPPERIDARRTASCIELTLDFGADFRATLIFQRTPNDLPRGPRTTRVVGEAATLLLDEASHRVELQTGGTVRTLFAADAATPLRSQLDHFLDCIGGRTVPRSTASTAALAVSILEKAERILHSSLAREGAPPSSDFGRQLFAPSSRG